MIRLVLLGFGSVNQDLCRITLSKSKQLSNLLNGDEIKIVGVSDSKGAIFYENGFDISKLLNFKAKSSVIKFPKNGNQKFRSFPNCEIMLADKFVDTHYDMLIDGSPANITSGYPGLQCCLYALNRNKMVVTANKAPLVLDFQAFHLPKFQNKLRYSACVCGGLPVVNVLKHDIMPQISNVTEIKGIFNSTTNYILTKISESIESNGDEVTIEQLLRHAVQTGVAETDPTLDVNGTDAVNKLCIIMNILGVDARPSGFHRIAGLETVTEQQIKDALARGNVIKMVAEAVPDANSKSGWRLTVDCREIARDSFLGRTTNMSLCIETTSDLFGRQCMKTKESGVNGTSAAVLRDIISLHTNDRNYNNICKL